jgi:hypothetical protein
MSEWPCLDEHRRYRSFPCSQCKAATCWRGKKPASARPITLHAGQRACDHCGIPYHASGRNRYCSETCRYDAMMKRRRARRAA